MKLTLSERTVVCRPIGRLDVTSAVALRDVLLGDPEPGTEVVLDLSAVTAFDASGLAVLVRSVRLIWRTGRSVRIVDPRPHLGTMLSLTAIHRLVPVEVAGATPGGRAA